MAQWLERRQHYVIFFWPEFNPHPGVLVIFFFFWPGFNPLQSPPRVIRVKGDRYCIFAFIQDTNNFYNPLGEKSTNKFTQRVKFTYSEKKWHLLWALLWRQSTTSDIYTLWKLKKMSVEMSDRLLDETSTDSDARKKNSSGLKLHWKILHTFPKCCVHAWFHSNELLIAEKKFATSQKPSWLSG